MILVTGATGLIGSYLLFELAQKENVVKALARDTFSTAHVQKLFTYLDPQQGEAYYKKIEWVKGDVLDMPSLAHALQDVAYVYHCAGFVSFNDRDLPMLLKVNASGTANVVNLCLEKKIKKLCHISSVASLGQPENGQSLSEKSFWKTSKKNSAYAVSKYNGEREVWRGIEEGLDAVIVNPSVVIGAFFKQNNINKFFQTLKKFKAYHTSGVNGFVDVRDVANSMILLMESPITGERFIINGENSAFEKLMLAGCKALGKPPKSTLIPNGLIKVGVGALALKDIVFPSHNMVSARGLQYLTEKTFYSSDKFKAAFPDFVFTPLEESIQFAFELLKKQEN